MQRSEEDKMMHCPKCMGKLTIENFENYELGIYTCTKCGWQNKPIILGE